MTQLLRDLSDQKEFVTRHNGPRDTDQQTMLTTIQTDSLETLINETIPESIRLPQPLQLSPP
ncbi:hypothetical protein P4S72_15765 [Vibrio sp. PP-XX7]